MRQQNLSIIWQVGFNCIMQRRRLVFLIIYHVDVGGGLVYHLLEESSRTALRSNVNDVEAFGGMVPGWLDTELQKAEHRKVLGLNGFVDGEHEVLLRTLTLLGIRAEALLSSRYLTSSSFSCSTAKCKGVFH